MIVDGIVRVGRKGSASKAFLSLREEVAGMYGIAPADMPGTLSQQYLQRMRKVMTDWRQYVAIEKEDGDKTDDAFGIARRNPQEPQAFLDDFVSYVQSWARDPSGKVTLRRNDIRTYSRILKALGVKPKVWHQGTEAIYVDVESHEIAPLSVRRQRAATEFGNWFRTFVEQELRNGEACLQEIASRIDTAPTVGDIVKAVGTDEAKLRSAATVAVLRGSRKDALAGDTAVGFYHLQRAAGHSSSGLRLRTRSPSSTSETTAGVVSGSTSIRTGKDSRAPSARSRCRGFSLTPRPSSWKSCGEAAVAAWRCSSPRSTLTTSPLSP
jgi:hypothetical protein